MKRFEISFRKALASWYEKNARDLPWRRTSDPYPVWISEIMLQQTRVAAVIPYYLKFLERFPSVEALAAAADNELLQAWAGLGYYSRARNLREAARRIAAVGAFPATHDEIIKLPGIGPYTAAAISSISFGERKAVLDGNVLRVLSRLTANRGDIQSTKTRLSLLEIAQTLIDPKKPARHNQAMMELGATVCIPKEPRCCECPVEKLCNARTQGLERELPIKNRKAKIRRVRRTLLVAIQNGHILLWQRPQDAPMLGGFWELPEPDQLPAAISTKLVHQFKHAITNRIYEFQVMEAKPRKTGLECQWIRLDSVGSIPLSTVARKALAPWYA